MRKIGIIREGKIPPDSRVPLSPEQVQRINSATEFQVIVEPSAGRVFTDQEYQDKNIVLSTDLSACDILLGVKEVPIDQLIPNKTYFFFSHTIKEQAYNRDLLKACVEKNIRLIDYEVLTNDQGQRVIAFGKFAGMVGAHNALWTWAQREKTFELPRMHTFREYQDAIIYYQNLDLPPLKIVLTGTGRVAQGAAMVLEDMGIKKVRPFDFVTHNFEQAVFTQVNSFFYAKRKDGREFEDVQDFYNNPSEYESDFHHFLPHADIFINGIYWDNDAPPFFTLEQMTGMDFNIKVIADVTCDIAPVSSIPSTLKASTIDHPVFGFDRYRHTETEPYQATSIDMMTIDNLPNELPRDASRAFGEMFIKEVLPELGNPQSELLMKASITQNGDLGPHFEYLRAYLEGK